MGRGVGASWANLEGNGDVINGKLLVKCIAIESEITSASYVLAGETSFIGDILMLTTTPTFTAYFVTDFFTDLFSEPADRIILALAIYGGIKTPKRVCPIFLACSLAATTI